MKHRRLIRSMAAAALAAGMIASAAFPAAAADTAYWNAQMTQDEQDMYKTVSQGLKSGSTSVSGYFDDMNARQTTFKKICKLVNDQNPEIFWFTNSQSLSTSSDGQYTFSMKYRTGYDSAKVKETQAAIDAVVKPVLEKLPQDPYGKVKAIYEWVIGNNTYDQEAFDAFLKDTGSVESYRDSYEIVGVFLKQKSVCEGYTKAFQYLCDLAGIPCMRVIGTADYGKGYLPHAWNYVQLDGAWYLIDTTWADTFTNGAPAFFLRGSDSVGLKGKTIGTTHKAETNEYITYPALSKTAYTPK